MIVPYRTTLWVDALFIMNNIVLLVFYLSMIVPFKTTLLVDALIIINNILLLVFHSSIIVFSGGVLFLVFCFFHRNTSIDTPWAW